MQILIISPNLQTQKNLVNLWTQVQNVLAKPPDFSRQQDEANLRINLARAEPKKVAQKLDALDPLHRLVAVQTIGQRRLHLEAEVIDRLNDAEPLIRQAAHHALVRLARGADFGPRVSASKVERSQAMRKWRAWLDLQGPSTLAKSAPPTGLEAEALQLCTQFLQTSGKDQDRLLTAWQDKEGEAVTLALAGVLAELKIERHIRVRQALTDRLAAFDNEIIVGYLTDDDPELRRAAARAVAVKKAEELIPELLKTLEDDESMVVQSARSSLRKLTSKDFGPEPAAPLLERFGAIGQWYRWWNERAEKLATKN